LQPTFFSDPKKHKSLHFVKLKKQFVKFCVFLIPEKSWLQTRFVQKKQNGSQCLEKSWSRQNRFGPKIKIVTKVCKKLGLECKKFEQICKKKKLNDSVQNATSRSARPTTTSSSTYDVVIPTTTTISSKKKQVT